MLNKTFELRLSISYPERHSVSVCTHYFMVYGKSLKCLMPILTFRNSIIFKLYIYFVLSVIVISTLPYMLLVLNFHSWWCNQVLIEYYLLFTSLHELRGQEFHKSHCQLTSKSGVRVTKLLLSYYFESFVLPNEWSSFTLHWNLPHLDKVGVPDL